MSLKADARLVISSTDENLPGAFSRGTAALLEGVSRLGSLNKAAHEMGMSYSKAWRIVKEAEAVLGFDLMARDGARGSTLTHKGKEALATYQDLEKEIAALINKRIGRLL